MGYCTWGPLEGSVSSFLANRRPEQGLCSSWGLNNCQYSGPRFSVQSNLKMQKHLKMFLTVILAPTCPANRDCIGFRFRKKQDPLVKGYGAASWFESLGTSPRRVWVRLGYHFTFFRGLGLKP